MSRPALRMLHTSDVHLGAYETRDTDHDRVRCETVREMFARVIDLGRAQAVDFMVIAGDFFDHAHVRTDTFEFAAAQIARLGVPVVLAPGNHDHVGPGSVYDRFDLATRAPNLTITRDPAGQTVAFDRLGVEIWARSHTEQDPVFAPIAGAPPRGGAPWQIGVAHGHYIHPDALMSGNFHIYREHISALDYDYVALGHWEVQARVDGGAVTAAYSGAPEGLAGAERRRVLIVDLEPDGRVRLASHSLTGAPTLAHDEIPLLAGMTPEEARRPGRGV